MLKKILLILIANIAIGSQAYAISASATYNVNRIVGGIGTISGTIKTDGTIGTLQQANIIDWNLSINADSNLASLGQLLGPQSGNNSSINLFPSAALSATFNGLVSTLYFDFGGSGETFQVATSNNAVVWQMQGGVPFQDELIRESGPDFPIQAFEFRGSTLAAIGVTSAVPETENFGLMMSGLALIAIAARRKKTL